MSKKRLPSPPYNPGVGELAHHKRQWAKPLSTGAIRRGFLGWHESGYLPHRDEPGLIQFVTFSLADAFPLELRSEWEALFDIENERKRRIELEAYLDRGHGACHLRQPDIAALVDGALRHFHGERYELRAWAVMPNHVHVLFQVQSVPMCQVLDSWKSYTAKAANKLLSRGGKFWQEGYWDTYMRDLDHEKRTVRYVENNPVKAGLTRLAKDWPWTSARFRDEYARLLLRRKS